MSDAVLLEWQRHRPRSWAFSRDRANPATVRIAAPTAIGLVLLSFACLLLVFAATSVLRLRPVMAPSLPPPPPEWLDVPRPIHIFDLESPVLRGTPLVYAARRRSAGDGREDMLVFGAPGLDAPALRLRLVRREGPAGPPPPLFAAVAQQAAESGLSVTRSSLADILPTRFGAFEIADVTLTDAKSAAVPCSGFRLALAAPTLTIGGLACGGPGKSVTRGMLACLLDRLDLHSGGEDRAIIDFFAASERRRDPNCRGARLAPDALHAAWLDDKPATHPRTPRRH